MAEVSSWELEQHLPKANKWQSRYLEVVSTLLNLRAKLILFGSIDSAFFHQRYVESCLRVLDFRSQCLVVLHQLVGKITQSALDVVFQCEDLLVQEIYMITFLLAQRSVFLEFH